MTDSKDLKTAKKVAGMLGVEFHHNGGGKYRLLHDSQHWGEYYSWQTAGLCIEQARERGWLRRVTGDCEEYHHVKFQKKVNG